MEREEFQEKLKGLSLLAQKKGNKLTIEEIQAFLADVSLTKEQMQLVYEYLTANQIKVEGYEAPKAAKEVIPYTQEEQTFIRSYQRELRKYKRLKEKELEELLLRAEDGEDLAKAQAAEQFLLYVLEQAKELHGQGLVLEDLVQEGNVGLMLSLETIGLREADQTAASYVQAEIRRAMEEALEESVSVHQAGEQIADKVNWLSDNIQQLNKELERQVTMEELSAFLDMGIEEIEAILKLAGDGSDPQP